MTPPRSPTAPSPVDTDRRRSNLLSLIALLLVLSFVTVGIIQWQQYRQLIDKVHDSRDNQQYHAVQFVAEYQNLRQELLELKISGNFRNLESATHRYEIFLSRISLIAPDMMADLLEPTPAHARLMQHLSDFTVQADPYLSVDATQPLTEAKLDELRSSFLQIREEVHDLATAGFHRHGMLTLARNEVVKEQNVTRLVLTGYLFALTLLFAVLALRQFRHSERQRATLHEQAKRLHDALQLAEAGSRAKDSFLATMSHELRTPFNGMLGMLELVQDEPLSAQQRAHIATVQSSGQHLLGLLNDMLDAARLEAGGLHVHAEPFELSALLQDLTRLGTVEAQARGLQFHCTIAPEVPAWVCGDGSRLRQILLNLLSNALKFCPHGEVRLQVSTGQPHPTAADLDASAPEAEVLEFALSDTGIGMDADALSRLFKRFSQADSSISRHFGGTGLGLEISRNLARLMGGDITATSQPGVGSTFTLQLPLQACQAPTAATLSSPAAVLPAIDMAHRPQVLLVEDHPVNQQLMQSHLAHLGCAYRTVQNGLEALAAVQVQVPDIILMDLHMPGMNGFEATRALRNLPGEAGRVCIIALTADAQSEVRDHALAAGMNDFLTKPLRRADLRDILQRHARLQAAQPASVAAQSPAAALPVDLDQLLDRALIGELREDFSPAGYARMLARLLSDHAQSYGRVIATLQGGDYAELSAQAHSLKGAAASFGLRGIAAVAAQIEQAGAALLPQEAEVLLAALQDQWALSQRICQQLKLLDTEADASGDAAAAAVPGPTPSGSAPYDAATVKHSPAAIEAFDS